MKTTQILIKKKTNPNITNTNNKTTLNITTIKIKKKITTYLNKKTTNKPKKNISIYIYKKIYYKKYFIINLKLIIKKLL